MSDTPIPSKNRRSKRRAAIEAADKIKKIVHGNDLDDEEAELEAPKQKPNAQRSLFFLPSPPLSVSLSSLSSIPEDLCLSESTNFASILSSSSSPEDRSEFFETALERANEEMEREFRRRERLINSTGPMYLSEKTAYRVSLFSPQKSPFRATKLSLTPFAGVPTTPMHVYQYRPPAPSSSKSRRKHTSSKGSSRKVRSRIRAKGGNNIKPRQLI